MHAFAKMAAAHASLVCRLNQQARLLEAVADRGPQGRGLIVWPRASPLSWSKPS